MNQIAHLLFNDFFTVIWPAAVFFILLIVGLLIRKIVFIELIRWAEKTDTQTDDIIIHAIRRPFIIWCVMLSLYLALNASSVSNATVNIAGKILLVLGIASVTLVLANISSALIKAYSGKIEGALPVTSLTQNIARIAILGIGILVILHSLGVSITPILATLGVGGLAVALALQDTLSNLFSGLHITANKQVRAGDYIKLESGQEGHVIDINWRTTKIRTPENNVAWVPNTKLAQAIIVNYHLPSKETAFGVNLVARYDDDLKKLEKIIAEVAKETMAEVPGGILGFEPPVRCTGFGEYGVNLAVGLKAREFSDQHLIRHEFIKRLLERYAKEGIFVPYPTRIIHTAK